MVKHTKDSDDNRIVHIYESIKEFLDHIKDGADRKGASHYGEFDNGYGRDEEFYANWTGTKSFAEALQLQATGWHQSRPKVDAILEPLREKLADKLGYVSERFHDVIGYEPDIDRLLAGEMECMYDDLFVEAPSNGRVYTLLVSGAVNSHVSAETLMKRGAAIVALVEAFQMVGSDVEIWVEDSFRARGTNKSKGRTFTSLVRIHRAGENLDIDSIMFPLAHPSWFRRFGFAEAESLPRTVREEFGFVLGGGYGQAADLCVMDIVEPTFTITKGGESNDTRKMDSDPLAFILDTLKAQGAFHDDEWGS